MAKPTDVIVLCVDVGPSMCLASLDDGETALEKSVRVAKQITQQKIFAGSKDLMGLVLFGTADAENDLASTDGGYANISVTHVPAQPTVDFLQFIASEVKPGQVSADFIDALVVSFDLLVKAAEDVKRLGDKRIYLMTDAGSEYSDNQLEQICIGLKSKNVELIVVGPSIIIDDDDTPNGDGGSPPGDGPGPSHQRRHRPPAKRTPQQEAGEAVIERLVREVEGSCFSFREALEVSTFLRKNAKKQTARFVGHLEIGDRLKIPCKLFTKVMVERPATWKKLSAVSQAAGASDGAMAVKMQRTYHLNDENESEVDLDNVAKGYRYGKSLIPISEADEKAMKFEAVRGLSVMGFTKMENVKMHQLVGSSVQVLVANPDDPTAGKAMSAFIHALYEMNMVGVARYVWRKDSQPKIMALVPKIKTDSEHLLVLQLPFTEDVRQFVFGSLPPAERPDAAPSAEQLNAVDALISDMDLMTAEIDEDGESSEAFKPKKTCNPLIQRTFQCIAHRALNPDDPLPEPEDSLRRLLQPAPSIVASCSASSKRIKELFPLERIVKATKQDDTAEVWKKSSELDLDSAAPAAKRPRGEGEEEEEVDFTMASLAKGKVTKVGTLNPVSDFETILAKKTFSFAEACKQLQGVILDLVKESFGDTLYGKAMECVKAYREVAIKHSEPDVFNTFLHELKAELMGTRYSAFWSVNMVTEGVTLVDSSQCAASTVPAEEAAKFLESDLITSDVAPPPPEDDMEDPDNLLALM